jgi:DNA-binding HxlR family transcriptional regulator
VLPPEQDDILFHDFLGRLADRWSVPIVSVLATRPRRFSQLGRALRGISRRMLAVTLQRLERDGLVSRVVLPTTPPQVQYQLAPLGQTLLVPMLALASWAASNRLSICEARDRFDRNRQSAAEGGVPS